MRKDNKSNRYRVSDRNIIYFRILTHRWMNLTSLNWSRYDDGDNSFHFSEKVQWRLLALQNYTSQYTEGVSETAISSILLLTTISIITR